MAAANPFVTGKKFTNITRAAEDAPASHKWELFAVLGDATTAALEPKLTLSRKLESGATVEYVGDAKRWLADVTTRTMVPDLFEALGTAAWDDAENGHGAPYFRMRIVSKPGEAVPEAVYLIVDAWKEEANDYYAIPKSRVELRTQMSLDREKRIWDMINEVKAALTGDEDSLAADIRLARQELAALNNELGKLLPTAEARVLYDKLDDVEFMSLSAPPAGTTVSFAASSCLGNAADDTSFHAKQAADGATKRAWTPNDSIADGSQWVEVTLSKGATIVGVRMKGDEANWVKKFKAQVVLDKGATGLFDVDGGAEMEGNTNGTDWADVYFLFGYKAKALRLFPLEANDKASLRFGLLVMKEGHAGIMAARPLTAEEIAATTAEMEAEDAAAAATGGPAPAAGGAGAASGTAAPVTN